MDLEKRKAEFISKAKAIYGDKYDYSKSQYAGYKNKLLIICKVHGEFWQTPIEHLKQCGCKECRIEAKTQKFISHAKAIHGDKFIYSKVRYKDSWTKVCITCPAHGDFWQAPASHLSGCGCLKCSLRSKDTYDFIKESKKIHGDRYDYSQVKYNNSTTKVCIICPTHGAFWQMPYSHLNGSGCRKCHYANRIAPMRRFIEKASKTHDNKYDYSKVKYLGSNHKVCIVCPKHGEFWQTPTNHVNNHGCPECAASKKSAEKTLGASEVIDKFKNVHGDKYDYSKVEYKGGAEKVPIICPLHGVFYQNPHDHMAGRGCPRCKESHGERAIARWLDDNKIPYIRQYKIIPNQVLFGINIFKVDFFLQNNQTIIEFNGIQHYIRQKHWQTEEDFQEQQDRDRRLRKYCRQRKIKLIEIPYTQKNKINQILAKHVR